MQANSTSMRAFTIKSIIILASFLPLRFAHMIGAIFGYLLLLFPNKSKQIAAKNIALCFPNLAKQQQYDLLKQTLIETGKTGIETGALWFWDKKQLFQLIKKTSGEQRFLAALGKKGVIILAPHLGAWELVGLYCASKGPMVSLYRPPRLEALDSFTRHARQRFGATLVPTNAKGVKTLYATVRDKYMIGILPDQDAGRSGNVFAPFFGIPASTMTLLSRLARKSGAEVIIVYAERLPKGQGFHLHFIPAPENTAHNDPTIAAIALNEGIEQCVRSTPAQYQWIYKRFKTRLEGEIKFY